METKGMKIPAWALFVGFFLFGILTALSARVTPNSLWSQLLTPFIVINCLYNGFMMIVALLTNPSSDKNKDGIPDIIEDNLDDAKANVKEAQNNITEAKANLTEAKTNIEDVSLKPVEAGKKD